MFELFKEAFPALQSEAATYSDGVRIWMRVMGLSFLSGLIFVGISRRALWIVAMALVTLASLILAKVFMPDIPRGTVGAITHLATWPIALGGLWWSGARVNHTPAILARVYPFWKIWVSFLIGFSLVMDARSLI